MNKVVPEDLFQEFDLVVWVFLGILLLKEGSGIGHGPCIYLKNKHSYFTVLLKMME